MRAACPNWACSTMQPADYWQLFPPSGSNGSAIFPSPSSPTSGRTANTTSSARRLPLPWASFMRRKLEDVDKVAGEICREIDAGIARDNRSIREINDKFKASTAQTVVGAVGGGLGLLVPTLA